MTEAGNTQKIHRYRHGELARQSRQKKNRALKDAHQLEFASRIVVGDLPSHLPDFYLPEFDLYVELTTMKQANVTRKNRKIRLLRAIYPHVNIQVFYQKDVQDLVMKYRLPERTAR